MADTLDPREREPAAEGRMLLAAVRAAVAELRVVLDAERSALDRRDSLALDAATSTKAEVLQRLQLLGTERDQLDDLATSSPAADAWHEIRRQLDACRRVNAANGFIVDAQLRHVHRALNILGGGDGGPPNVYGPRGHVKPHPAQRSLTSV